MEKSSKRGKIPQGDWPSIISRYESGETLASIARTYDCSPPAISYIVSRSRARSAVAEGTAPKTDASATAEPQLVKTAPSPTLTSRIADGEFMHRSDSSDAGAMTASPTAQPVVVEHSTKPAELNDKNWPTGPRTPSWAVHDAPDSERPARGNREPRDNHSADAQLDIGSTGPARAPGSHGGLPQTGEARRTLHLSLPQGNGSTSAAASNPALRNATNSTHAPDGQSGWRPQGQQGLAPQPRPAPLSGPLESPFGGGRGPGAEPDRPPKTRESGAFIDHALRERIDDDIAAFLAAFDAALDHDTVESRTGLREATDRLLRAGARTRIELERLEARVPLPARDSGSPHFQSFRPR